MRQPGRLRNDIARLEVSGERSAGAVQLLDKRWRRRAIGIVSGATEYADRVTTVVHEFVPFDDAARAHALMNEPATFGKIVLTLTD